MEPSIALDELHSFHSIDRDVFSRLVLTFQRDIAESLLVVATWFWLEDEGYPNVMQKMAVLPDPMVDALADEGASCLQVLVGTAPFVPRTGGLPLHSKLMEREVRLKLFKEKRFAAISGIKNFLNTVCARIFTDILYYLLGDPLIQVTPDNPLNVPGFPHPVFGAVTIFPRAISHDFPTGGLWGWDSSSNVTEDDRTMFLTFSRGFHVTEEEVKELFTDICGQQIESLQMQQNIPANAQPLFAKLVLPSVAVVDKILSGLRVAKFQINRKHIWARKYERRDNIRPLFVSIFLSQASSMVPIIQPQNFSFSSFNRNSCYCLASNHFHDFYSEDLPVSKFYNLWRWNGVCFRAR